MQTKLLISSVTKESWKKELEDSSSRFHIFGAWVGAIFDPLFAASDYYNIQDHWKHLLFIRISISFIVLLSLWLYKKLRFPSYFLVVLTFLLISLQNAYTFSLIGNDHLLGHCLNYMALLLGGAMFFFWTWQYSTAVIGISAVATGYFVSLNPHINSEIFIVRGGLLLLVMGLFMIVLIKVRYDLTLREIKARLALRESNFQLEAQKAVIEEKNQKITDSINYARRIQESILEAPDTLNSWLPDAFILFKPRDTLSGDFYWFYRAADQDLKIVIVADCTGHGVPAALMTILGSSILNEIVLQQKIFEPDKILNALDSRVINSLNKSQNTDFVDDGMDIGILCIEKKMVCFASAKTSLCKIQEGEIHVIKGSPYTVGGMHSGRTKHFDVHRFAAQEGSKFYLFSDGFADQFGGAHDRKYSSPRFRALLLATSTLDMKSQGQRLDNELEQWKAGRRQTDDILVVGITI